MRILFATNKCYLPQKVGGAETSTHLLALALKKEGATPAVLARFSPEGFIGLQNRIMRHVLSHIKCPTDHWLGYPVYRTWSIEENMAEVVRRFSPSIAVLMPSIGSAVSLAKPFQKQGIPVVLHARDVEPESLGDLHHAPIAGVVANSRFTAARIKERYGIDSTFVMNIVDEYKYKTTLSGNFITFINPVPQKGVEIAFHLAEKNPELPFLFVEGWPLRPERKQYLLTRARALGNIKWHDRVVDMRKIYQLTKILLVPSQWEEAWGRVVSEAHISGIPVLASNRGGLPEAVGSGGLLVPHDDLSSWQEALRSVWNCPAKWMSLSEAALAQSKLHQAQQAQAAKEYIKILGNIVR